MSYTNFEEEVITVTISSLNLGQVCCHMLSHVDSRGHSTHSAMAPSLAEPTG